MLLFKTLGSRGPVCNILLEAIFFVCLRTAVRLTVVSYISNI